MQGVWGYYMLRACGGGWGASRPTEDTHWRDQSRPGSCGGGRDFLSRYKYSAARAPSFESFLQTRRGRESPSCFKRARHTSLQLTPTWKLEKNLTQKLEGVEAKFFFFSFFFLSQWRAAEDKLRSSWGSLHSFSLNEEGKFRWPCGNRPALLSVAPANMTRRPCAIYAVGTICALLLVSGIGLILGRIFQTIMHNRLKKVTIMLRSL